MSVDRLQMANRRQVERTQAFKYAKAAHDISEWNSRVPKFYDYRIDPSPIVSVFQRQVDQQLALEMGDLVFAPLKRFSGRDLTLGQAVAEMSLSDILEMS